jgi:hypothetical protein
LLLQILKRARARYPSFTNAAAQGAVSCEDRRRRRRLRLRIPRG